MKSYTDVSRKTVGEDRIAICPKFGCEFMRRVKPLKMKFFGFGKHPKCKKHHLSLVYVDERIGDFIDGALACFFDKAGLPPNELLEAIQTKFPEELESYLKGWIYCITVGRGAPIVSQYMDAISNGYLKQLTKKQVKAFKKGQETNTNMVSSVIKGGLNEIANQYTRLLTHLRVHSGVLTESNDLKPLSTSLRNYLIQWQENTLRNIKTLTFPETNREMTLKEIKHDYDDILNVYTCRCLLGLNPESREVKKTRINAFDRFSAYLEFYKEGLSVKFIKSDIEKIIHNKYYKKLKSIQYEFPDSISRKYPELLNPILVNSFLQYSKEFKDKTPNFGTRYITKDFLNWLDNRENSEEFHALCIIIEGKNILKNFIIDLIQTTNLNLTQIVEKLEMIGLSFNRMTIKNLALEYVYAGDVKRYTKRFPRSIHRQGNMMLTNDISEEYLIPENDDPKIFYYDNKFKMSTRFIEIITQIIYEIIVNIKLKNKKYLFSENKEIEKIVKKLVQSKNILDHSPISRPGFLNFFNKTIKDFVVIICSLEVYNQNSNGDLIKLEKFGQELIDRHYNLDLALTTLRNHILPKILSHLNSSFTEFNLKSLNRRTLEQDDDGKVCGYCGIKKPWNEYRRLPDGGYVSKCNQCMAIYGEIMKYKKKLRLLFELNSGKYNGECANSNCSIEISQLPAFDFHHPLNKKNSWKRIQKKKFLEIKELLEEDGVLPLCRNCHAPKQQTIFLDYKNLILNKFLFRNESGNQKTPKELNKSIDEAILNHPNLNYKVEKDSQYMWHIKYMIKSWIRKRAIAEQLFEGKCINCGETKLHSLTFHHVKPEKKKDIGSEAFRKFTIKQLASKMIQEGCICLCANCHAMIESTIFRDHTEEIFRDIKNKDFYIRKVKKFYHRLTINIQDALNTLLKIHQNFPIIDYLDGESK